LTNQIGMLFVLVEYNGDKLASPINIYSINILLIDLILTVVNHSSVIHRSVN